MHERDIHTAVMAHWRMLGHAACGTPTDKGEA